MVIGVPKEIKNNENRVGLTPAGAEALVKAGHKVLVEQGGGLGVGHGFPRLPQALQEGVEFIGHGVMGALPVITERQVGRAPNAQVILPGAQGPSAYQAHPRHQQICQFTHHAPKLVEAAELCDW